MISTIEILRERTRPIHDQLEKSPISAAITGDNPDLQVVSEFLQWNCVCLQVLEPILFAHWQPKELANEFGYSSEVGLLKGDLESLNPTASPPKTPAKPPFPLDNSLEYAIGGLYVLLGSKLGRQQIKKHLLNKKIQWIETSAYFNAPPLNGNQWKHFLQTLNDLGSTTHSRTELLQGANDFFTVFSHYQNQIPRV